MLQSQRKSQGPPASRQRPYHRCCESDQLLPMRHDPAPIWKKNLNDLRHLCDDLLSEHDEDIIDAWAALGELENPATRVCRKVAKLCKKEKEKGAGQEL